VGDHDERVARVALGLGLAALALAVATIVWLGRRAVQAIRGFRRRAQARFPAGPGALG